MSTEKKPDQEASVAPSKKTVILLIGTVADTSARLFIPTVLGCVLGLWADYSFNTLPWFFIAGTTIGTILAGILVYLQIKNISKGSK